MLTVSKVVVGRNLLYRMDKVAKFADSDFFISLQNSSLLLAVSDRQSSVSNMEETVRLQSKFLTNAPSGTFYPDLKRYKVPI